MTGGCPFCSPEDEDIGVTKRVLVCTVGPGTGNRRAHAGDSAIDMSGIPFDLSSGQWHATVSVVKDCRAVIESGHFPDGFNIGFYVGRCAGQSVLHCHCHLGPPVCRGHRKPDLGDTGGCPPKRLYQAFLAMKG